jgi:hypothetical protein
MSDLRRAVVAGGAVLFGLGFVLGFLLGRTRGQEEPPPPPAASPTSSPTASLTSPVVTTPSPGEEPPAISNQGRILAEGDRPIVAAPATTACAALLEPGTLGECGEVPVGGQRVLWVVQRSATAAGSPAFTVRVFTFVPDAGGWVEWLRAADPTGERWSQVRVLASDLTADGVPELLVGFRGVGEARTLEYDIVGYTEQNLPEVLAHPEPAPRGVVVISAGTVVEYGARYPGGEPLCCPPSYLRRTIAFRDGFFRVVEQETVVAAAVPASQL